MGKPRKKAKAKKQPATKLEQRYVSENRVVEREQQGWKRVKDAAVLRNGSVLMEKRVPA